MKVAIRADASVNLGIGHVMRCLALAGALRSQGAAITFLCRNLPGNCCDLIENDGFSVIRLPGKGDFNATLDAELTVTALADLHASTSSLFDWLIVDHYGIGAGWESRQRQYVDRIMVIDDLADRQHDCDVLLDQNLVDGADNRYALLTPPHCRIFTGPRNALLREEFIQARRTVRKRDSRIKRVLVCFGGSDPTNETVKTLLALNMLDLTEIAVDVVVGQANPYATKIMKLCRERESTSFYVQVENMAELMSEADLAIGGGGGTTWERCFLGLPAMIIVVADNQATPAQAVDKAGLALLVGNSRQLSVDGLASFIAQSLEQPGIFAEMSNRCLSYMPERSTSVHEDLMTCILEGVNAA